MSDQLATDLRAIVDDGAPPITLAELERAWLTEPPPRPRRRWLVPAAVAAAAVMLIAGGVALAVARHDTGNVVLHTGPAPVPAPPAPAPAPTALGGPEVQGPDAASTLLTSHAQMHGGYAFIYADGRVIWHLDRMTSGDHIPEDDISYERHLTTAGVDLVWSGDLAPWDFVDGDLGRSDVWTDPKNTPWTPTEYAGCIWELVGGLEPRDAMNRWGDLPAAAQALLHTRRAFPNAGLEVGTSECFALTPPEARAVLDLIPTVIPVVPGEGEVSVLVSPVLPHGAKLAWGG